MVVCEDVIDPLLELLGELLHQRVLEGLVTDLSLVIPTFWGRRYVVIVPDTFQM